MFKCKKIENYVTIQAYLEELNKNYDTHLMELICIANCENKIISNLQHNFICPIEYERLTIFQNIYEAEKFLDLFKIECKNYIYRNYYHLKINNIIDTLDDAKLYNDNELVTMRNYIIAMREHDDYIFSYYEDEEFGYEFNYEEDITTLNALIYPYQLFL